MTEFGVYAIAYHPLVDLYRNPHIGAKTVLTLGDGSVWR